MNDGSDDLVGIAQRIAERAGSGEEIEAFLTHEKSFYVKAYSGEVESLSSAEPRGAGVRVVSSHRVGFAYTTDLSESGLEAVVAQARDNAAHATADEAIALTQRTDGAAGEIGGLVDSSQWDVGPEEKAELALELERATREADPRIRAVEEAIYSDSDATIAVANSNGVSAAYRRTDAWCYAVAIASDQDDSEVGFEFDLGRGMRSLDPQKVAATAVERAVRVLGARKIPSERMPVVLDPYTAGEFLGVLGQALTGEAVQKGRSLFAGRTGEQVAAEGLTLIDDGRWEGAPGAAPWDAEGVPTTRTEVIGQGVLKTFLYDTISARREGRTSTGNASRAGFKSIPHPAPSNLALEATASSREEVLGRAGRALFVQDFHGVHSGANPISGDFSVGVTGRLLDDGHLGQPVKEITIAAPMLDILRGIVAVASDRRWLPFGGSYGGATTLVEEMTVAGA